MKRISNIATLSKKIYRSYGLALLGELQQRGFNDLRPSFLEILNFICEHDGPSIKSIGNYCGLKKQTMTSHLNELEKRGYIIKKIGEKDRREQRVFLTEYGEKFKFILFEIITDLERKYSERIGDVELDRVELLLKDFNKSLQEL